MWFLGFCKKHQGILSADVIQQEVFSSLFQGGNLVGKTVLMFPPFIETSCNTPTLQNKTIVVIETKVREQFQLILFHSLSGSRRQIHTVFAFS
jgi:hypothetical protein